MSQGIRESLDHLIDRIEALTPKTDTHSGFIRLRDGLLVINFGNIYDKKIQRYERCDCYSNYTI